MELTFFDLYGDLPPFKNLGPWELLQGTILKNIHGSVTDSSLTHISPKSPHEVVVTIHPHAYFSNGQPLTAQDVIWSLERAIGLKALRHTIFTNNNVSFTLEDEKRLTITSSGNMASVLDELSAVAYLIFPESSLSDDDYIPHHTPGLGAYKLTKFQPDSIELVAWRPHTPITKLTVLPHTVRHLHNNIFAPYPNAVLRCSKSSFQHLQRADLCFHDIGVLYAYLLPQTPSPLLEENLHLLRFLHKTLDRQALCKTINAQLGIEITGISHLGEEAPPLHDRSEIPPFHKGRPSLKIFGGNSHVARTEFFHFLNEFYQPYGLTFVSEENKEEADFIWIGHMTNKCFPLKSLPYFFGDGSLWQEDNSTLGAVGKFLEEVIEPLQSSSSFQPLTLFNEFNETHTTLLPLFTDHFGYMSHRMIGLSLPEPHLLQNWSDVCYKKIDMV